MSKALKRASRFVLRARRLPVCARVGLTLLAAGLALEKLRSSPDFTNARHAVTLARRWHAREPVDPTGLADALEARKPGSVVLAIFGARSDGERAAWRALVGAIYYVAHQAFRAAGRIIGEPMRKFDERALDDVVKDLRKLEPSARRIIKRATAYLEQHPDASIARLKAHAVDS